MVAPRVETVSLAVICGDAQRDYAARLLKSVAEYPARLFDETVLCWNGKLAPPDGLGPGVRVVQQTWRDDFARARNESFAACSGDWIAWADCDDVIAQPHAARAVAEANARGGHEPLRVPLGAWLTAHAHGVAWVWCPYDYSRDTPIQLHPRIFRRSVGWVWEGAIHEETVTNEAAPQALEYWGLLWVQHSVQTTVDRNNRNVPLIEKAMREGRATPSTYFYLARAREDDGREREAVELYREAVKRAKASQKYAHRVYHAASLGALCALKTRDHVAACEFAAHMVRERPGLPEAWNALCVAASTAGRHKAAVRAFLEAERRRGRARETMFTAQPEFAPGSPIVLACAGQSAVAIGRRREARVILDAIPATDRAPEIDALIAACERR